MKRLQNYQKQKTRHVLKYYIFYILRGFLVSIFSGGISFIFFGRIFMSEHCKTSLLLWCHETNSGDVAFDIIIGLIFGFFAILIFVSTATFSLSFDRIEFFWDVYRMEKRKKRRNSLKTINRTNPSP